MEHFETSSIDDERGQYSQEERTRLQTELGITVHSPDTDRITKETRSSNVVQSATQEAESGNDYDLPCTD